MNIVYNNFTTFVHKSSDIKYYDVNSNFYFITSANLIKKKINECTYFYLLFSLLYINRFLFIIQKNYDTNFFLNLGFLKF